MQTLTQPSFLVELFMPPPKRSSALRNPDRRQPSLPPVEPEAHISDKDDGTPAPGVGNGNEVRVAAPAAARTSLETLREAALRCRACPLWRHATQTVFGEGGPQAPLLIVGEQPGNNEDLSGHPFVGPAGQLLEQALAANGIARDQLYITNAVKHFKWELRGKRRLHKTPTQREIEACRPWLETEIALVRPRVVLCLGATAARAVLGATVRISEYRGQSISTPAGYQVVITTHPAYVLRLKAGAAEEAYRLMEEDLTLAARIALEQVGEAELSVSKLL